MWSPVQNIVDTSRDMGIVFIIFLSARGVSWAGSTSVVRRTTAWSIGSSFFRKVFVSGMERDKKGKR